MMSNGDVIIKCMKSENLQVNDKKHEYKKKTNKIVKLLTIGMVFNYLFNYYWT